MNLLSQTSYNPNGWKFIEPKMENLITFLSTEVLPQSKQFEMMEEDTRRIIHEKLQMLKSPQVVNMLALLCKPMYDAENERIDLYATLAYFIEMIKQSYHMYVTGDDKKHIEGVLDKLMDVEWDLPQDIKTRLERYLVMICLLM